MITALVVAALLLLLDAQCPRWSRLEDPFTGRCDMEVNTLPKAAAAILGDIRRLTKMVVEQLQDPALFGDPALESSIEHILDRFCLSVQLAKPVGLSTWAVREGRRLGSQRTSGLTDAVAHVVATEAARFGIDQGRLLALLEVLKTEIRSALSAVSDDCGESQSAYTETAEALLAMLGERDSQTCCHSKATGEWARRICTALELDEEKAISSALRHLARHRQDRVLRIDPVENRSLTPREWSVMREHPAAGQRILKQIPSLAHCAAIVRAHHERWDGLATPTASRARAFRSKRAS